MRLHHFEDPCGNFGDDLDRWLWRRLAPALFDHVESGLLVGIGTLLNHRLPAGPVKHALGSGPGLCPRRLGLQCRQADAV